LYKAALHEVYLALLCGQLETDNRRLDAPPVKISVGPDKAVFYVDHSALVDQKGFFEAALKKEWKEGQERLIELPEDDPHVFGIYARWLYTDWISCASDADPKGLSVLPKLYVLAEKMLDWQFQDQVMDSFIVASFENTSETSSAGGLILPDVHTIDYICEHAPVKSSLRQFVFDMILGYADFEGKGCLTLLREVNREFLLDVTTGLLKLHKLTDDDRLDIRTLHEEPGCAYHHHGADEPCPLHDG